MKLFFLIIIFSFNFVENIYISADQEIVKDFNVTSEIPGGIRFRIELFNNSDIEDIQVKFKIEGRKSYQYEYLKLSKDNLVIEHYFSTLQSSRYMPPGSQIEYYFEIFYKDGSSVKTEKKKDVLLDSRFEWDKVSGKVVDVYFHGPVSRRAKNILNACEESVNDISELLGVDSNNRIALVMYNNYSEMFDVVVKKKPNSSWFSHHGRASICN